MSSYTGLSPKGPNHYVGPNVYLPSIVTRTREPTGADYRQPETGKLYPTGSFWLVGNNPTTGIQGDLWYLSKIVANVAFWVMLSTGTVGPIDRFVVQAATAPGVSPVLPTGAGVVTINGNPVANHSVPIETRSRALNAYNVEVQYATSAAATDATKSGLAHFNSTEFTVDANGFVALAGGGLAIDSIAVQTGTSPIVPTGAGLVTINGAVVAAGTNPVRTDGTGANTMAVEVQISQAIAATDATKIGLSNFNSAQFTVDANGFVSAAAAGIATTITGDTGGALPPTANNWNIFGGPGVSTSGSGSTLTINSVVFTDTTATTLAVDNGYNATAAGTYNMPATAAQGELITVFCDTAGAVVLDCPALNFIRIGNAITSAGGTATSTLQGDSLTLRYRLSTLTWEMVGISGNWLTA